MPEVTRALPNQSIFLWFRKREGKLVAVHTASARAVPYKGRVMRADSDSVELLSDGQRMMINYTAMDSWYETEGRNT